MIVGYNAQVAVDGKNKLIAAAEVTNAVTDLQQLADVALAAKDSLGIQRAEAVADKGYYLAASQINFSLNGVSAEVVPTRTLYSPVGTT